jgi:hypothetical protein
MNYTSAHLVCSFIASQHALGRLHALPVRLQKAVADLLKQLIDSFAGAGLPKYALNLEPVVDNVIAEESNWARNKSPGIALD